MTLTELRYAVAEGEGRRIEFKRKLPGWDKLIRELVAFANTDGGTLFIGVSDNGEIPGIRDAFEIEEALKLNLDKYARPSIPHRIETIPLNRKKSVVCIHIRSSKEKPHFALNFPTEERGTVLIRIEDKSCTASREMYELLRYQNSERNIKVEFGEKEQVLMRHLQEHDHITLKTFQKIARLKKQTASRTLVHLVKANLIQILPGPDEDLFVQRIQN